MSFQPVAEVSEVTADVPLPVDVDDIQVAIVFHKDNYYAIFDECSHGAVPLSEGDVEHGHIECYLHGSVFDLATGKALNLPATSPVPVYPCRVNGTTIEVDIDNPLTDQEF